MRDVHFDLFGVTISEGARVDVLSAGAAPFEAAASFREAHLPTGIVIASDETNVRVGRADGWLRVFQHGDSAVSVADDLREVRRRRRGVSPPMPAGADSGRHRLALADRRKSAAAKILPQGNGSGHGKPSDSPIKSDLASSRDPMILR